jgi:hypothetical protein
MITFEETEAVDRRILSIFEDGKYLKSYSVPLPEELDRAYGEQLLKLWWEYQDETKE